MCRYHLRNFLLKKFKIRLNVIFYKLVSRDWLIWKLWDENIKCNIEYIGIIRQEITKYYYTVYKSFAYDKSRNKLDECFWINKEIYDNILSEMKLRI